MVSAANAARTAELLGLERLDERRKTVRAKSFERADAPNKTGLPPCRRV